VLEVLKDRPVIPEEALIPTRTGYMVFVVDKSRRARGQSVEVGLRQPGSVEITKGVKPGDTVIQAGHISVKDGDRVCESENTRDDQE
jgi:membrane fusion protein (multidrug efflux system)